MVEAQESQIPENDTETPPDVGEAPVAEASLPQMPDDLYERLGVSENATPEEIDAAYREKAKEFGDFHPDRNKNSQETTEFFAKLGEAKQNLRDPKSKEKYNEARRQKKEQERATADAESRERERKRDEGASQARRGAERAYENESGGGAAEQAERRPETRERDETVYDSSRIKEGRYGRFVKIDGNEIYVGRDGRPLNPLWREQAKMVSPLSQSVDRMIRKTQDGYRAVEKIAQKIRHPFRLSENPSRSRRALEKYEEMVRAGQAEFVGEQETVNVYAKGDWNGSPTKKNPNRSPWKVAPNFDHFREIEKTYRKRGSFDNFKYEVVEVYNEQNRFTGKYRIYRIKK